jgi:hypothetical protein
MFPNSGWVHDAPPASGNISSCASRCIVWVNDSTNWGIPIQTADGSNGHVTFYDHTHPQGLSVPVPTGGFSPAVQADGHLVVVDPNSGQYWDFWELKAVTAIGPEKGIVLRVVCEDLPVVVDRTRRVLVKSCKLVHENLPAPNPGGAWQHKGGLSAAGHYPQD